MKKILVIGATGMLGYPVAQKLKERFDVRLLVRDLNKARHLLGEDFEYVIGDVFDKDSLNVALHGIYGVHINLSGDTELEGVKAIVNEAKGNGLKRITYISGSNVRKDTTWFPLERRKYEAEKAIVKSGIPFTIFRPTWFMESLQNFVRGKRAATFGDNPKPFHFIAAEDYAAMVTNAFEKREAAKKILYVHGPQSFRFKEALKMYVRVVHPEIKSVGVVPYFMGSLMGVLSGKKMIRDVVQLMKFFEKVGELGDPRLANKLLGTPKLTLDQWIERVAKSRTKALEEIVPKKRARHELVGY